MYSYHRERRKMYWHFTFITILILDYTTTAFSKYIDSTEIVYSTTGNDGDFDNNIIDFDSAYNDKYSKQFGLKQLNENNKDSHRYTVINENIEEKKISKFIEDKIEYNKTTVDDESEKTTESNFMPIEVMSTTEDAFLKIVDSTSEGDLTVIPLSTTEKSTPGIDVTTFSLPSSTQSLYLSTVENFDAADTESPTTITAEFETTTTTESVTNITTTKQDLENMNETTTVKSSVNITERSLQSNFDIINSTTNYEFLNSTSEDSVSITTDSINIKLEDKNTTFKEDLKHKNNTRKAKVMSIDNNNTTKTNETADRNSDDEVPIFTELDLEDEEEVPEDYYDAKDVVPTKPPSVDALSLIFGLAGSMVESVAERVVPKTIFDLYKRMQKQSEALEAERLRSREENGGLGQFGRGLLKSISTGLSAPFTQLMAGARDHGSLDSDRGFVAGLATGVSSVASSVVDTFKTRVQAIYPGTLWCGDGHSAQARSSDLGLFFFTDTCCRQHDACRLYIRAGETRHGLTNTGLFTRSHCSCDARFRECLQKTNSLVSGQIGLTYFNVLGPQCFRRAHPIVRCVRRTRITGQRCEEYELDYTKPKMWQWFDNETY
ncbi:hypothetical protein JYU34_014873 [Plutella xylostella]|uniref:phospholipase A2 n=1 Tax=Plutella xylostella TaxID=51655 RepID=A0ABQ7Q9F5_PLUXY|nr:hypothetical protein JYU34_014873 [Plutella xylostella]